ncbi:SDR family oxidoreductase [Urechidicola sp. KH5]
MPLAKKLAQQGYSVKGSNTSNKKRKELVTYGISSYIFSIEDLNQISDFLESNTLIVAITSKSIEAFEKFISNIEQSSIQQVLFISSTSVYPFNNAEVTELTETINKPLTKIEQLFIQNKKFKTTIVRFGGLFGPNRHPGNFIKRESQLNNPKGIVNLIHLEDCLAVLERIIKHGHWNQIFNACANSHPTRESFYTKQLLKLGKQKPVFNHNSETKYKIVNSDKLQILLNYSYKFDDLMLL